MNKIWFSLLCMFSIAVARVDMDNALPLAASLKASADEMNKELPVMVDEELRHDKVEIEGKTMTLKFTLVHFSKKEMDAKRLTSLMEADIHHNVCGNADSQMMLKEGMKIVYDYVDKNKNPITQFIYDAKVCTLKLDTKSIKKG